MSGSRIRPSVTGAFAATIFLSAFLLFQVQPLLSKAILPWFGGTPAVWTTCLLFFQTLLFAGYAYAHLLSRRFSPRGQLLVHAALIAAAVLTLPVAPTADWKPTGSEAPIVQILLLLSVSVGLPFFVLSSTGPLLQSWFARTHRGASPYRLYALSNVGSLLALVSYPFLFEPALDVATQSTWWSAGFGVFAVFCVGLAAWSSRAKSGNAEHPAMAKRGAGDAKAIEGFRWVRPTWGVRLLWFFLAMEGSVLLLATTNQVCLDVACVPFLWVMPLALYLLTFILCFDSERWYSRVWSLPMLVISIAGICAMMSGTGESARVLDVWGRLISLFRGSDASPNSLVLQIAVYFSGLFFCTMVCHGELVRLKPAPNHLTAFYLVISAGGAAGGVFVGVVAPLVFPSYLELHFALAGVSLLTLLVLFADRARILRAERPIRRRAVLFYAGWGLLLAGNTVLVGYLYDIAENPLRGATEVARNFYGVLRVSEADEDDPQMHYRSLSHGRILHGLQFVSPERRSIPTTYYGRNSAIGLVLANHRPGRPKHVGVVGLGVGTIAAYAQPGDRYRYYEINPDVVRLAEKHFTYLRDCRGKMTIVPGDARLTLEREEPPQFDVLALDAFSGDAIPAHLLTQEAFEVYKRHLKPDGVLVVHISNLYFDLAPVVAAAADRVRLQGVQVVSDGDDEQGTSAANWVVFARDLSRPEFQPVREAGEDLAPRRILWTDTFSNLLQVLK